MGGFIDSLTGKSAREAKRERRRQAAEAAKAREIEKERLRELNAEKRSKITATRRGRPGRGLLSAARAGLKAKFGG